MTDYAEIIDRYYEPGSRLREILVHHSRQVADKAMAIAMARKLPLDQKDIETGAMLHDIGIFLTDASGIECYGKEPYLRHGIIGARLLRDAGMPEWVARIAERHTGAGITAEDIRSMHLPLPERNLMPETLLERLICYADKFYSKNGDMKEKDLAQVRASMLRHSEATLARFETLFKEFGE